MNQLAKDNVWKHKNPLTRALLREGQQDGARNELLALVAPQCSEDELAALKALQDLDALRAAVYDRLGLPLPGTGSSK